MRRIIGCILLLSIFTACGRDPLAPSEANYRQGIAEYLMHNRVCVNLGITLPHTELAASRWPTWDRLVALKFLTSSEVLEPYSVSTFDQKYSALKVRVKRYQINERTPTEISTKTVSGLFSTSKRTELCFAEKTVQKILKTEGPKTKFGASMVEVNFQYAITKPSAWFTDNKEFLLSLDRDLKDDLSEQQTDQTQSIPLVLTKRGWRHPKFVKDDSEVLMSGEKS